MPVVMDADRMGRTLTRIAHEIVERNRGRGEPGARRRAHPRRADRGEAGGTPARDLPGSDVPVGALDITLYRDDLMLNAVGPQPLVRSTEIPFSIDDRVIVLVDDVLYTGRTVRAALDELIDFGRPKRHPARRDRGPRATANCRSRPTTSARTCPRRTPRACRCGCWRPTGATKSSSRRPTERKRDERRDIERDGRHAGALPDETPMPASRLRRQGPARHRGAVGRGDHAHPRHRRGDEGDRVAADQEGARAARQDRREPVLRAEHAHAHVVRDRREAPERGHAEHRGVARRASSRARRWPTPCTTSRRCRPTCSSCATPRPGRATSCRASAARASSTPATGCTSTRPRRCSTPSRSASGRGGSRG